MGIPMFFILVLFLKFFQLFSFFSSFFHLSTNKTSVALTGYGFARLFFVCPRTITSGLLYSENTLNLKIHPKFSVFGCNHD